MLPRGKILSAIKAKIKGKGHFPKGHFVTGKGANHNDLRMMQK